MYLASASMIILMLLAWHFSIQAAAHDAAIAQVRIWMNQMGAHAGEVQFRLLRGALTIQNIQAKVSGDALTIDYMFFKGNPASITSNTPKLSYINIDGFNLDATNLSQNWQKLQPSLPPSLQTIFRRVKLIHFQEGKIHHLTSSLNVSVIEGQISGSPNARHIKASGILPNSKTWQWHSVIPERITEQHTKYTSQGKHSKTQIEWTGFWNNKSTAISFIHKNNQSSISGSLKQTRQAWKGSVQTEAWPIDLPFLRSNITGEVHFQGINSAWILKSADLQWQDTVFKSSHDHIGIMRSQNIRIDTHKKTIQMSKLDVDTAHIKLTTDKAIMPKLVWHVSIPVIDVRNIYPDISIHDKVMKIVPLRGRASLKNNFLTYNLAGQINKEHWHIVSKKHDSLSLTASQVPMIKLRNLLPSPIQQKASSIGGVATVKLKIQPNKNWTTTGHVTVRNILLSSKHQRFQAKKLNLHIKYANRKGIKLGSLTIDTWKAQFPMTPRQAWSQASNFDEWASIPWQLTQIKATNGSIAIGQSQSVWVRNANLDIQNWQHQEGARLSLFGDMGLTPLQVSMRLKKHKEMMSWSDFTIDFEHANAFRLNEWLKISQLPHIEKGHISLDLQAHQNDKGLVYGNIDLSLYYPIFSSSSKNDYIQQAIHYPISLAVQALDAHKTLNLEANFKSKSNWGPVVANMLLQTVRNELDQASTSTRPHSPREKTLGSLRIHQHPSLSHNERTRLRKMIRTMRKYKRYHVELRPDLGTAQLTPALQKRIESTQLLIKTFLNERSIRLKNIYAITTEEKYRSTNDASAIHIILIR